MKACVAVSVVGTSLIALFSFPGCGSGAQAEAPAAAPAPAGAAPPDSAAVGAPAASAVGPAPAAASAAEPAAASAPAKSQEGAADSPAEGDSRTMEVIAAVVKAHRKDARQCYEKALKQIPGLKGDVVVHFTLKPSGKVKEIGLNKERSTITESSVVTCVQDVVSAIEFPKSSKGMETTVNYPFNFNP